jgi:hypothetical protein
MDVDFDRAMQHFGGFTELDDIPYRSPMEPSDGRREIKRPMDEILTHRIIIQHLLR